MNSFLLWCFCLLPCSALSFTLDKSYSCGKRHHCVAGKQQQLSHRRPSANSASSRRLVADGSVLETIVAGGIAGAIGIGVAFPFDTIRTNAVILNSAANRKKQLQLQQQNVQSGYPVSSTITASEAERSEAFSSTSLSASMSSTAEYMMESLSSSTITLPIPTFTSTSTTHSNPATSTSSSPSTSSASTSVTDESTPRNANLNMMQITAYIWEREGPQGFFSGVKSMMIGQAIVKAMAFSTNAYMIDFLQVNPLTHNLPHSATLLMAACMAGFVASFVVTPVERVSVLMQAQQTNKYASEMDCFLSVLRKEGPGDLFTRGLGATLCREVPSDGIYFWLYGLLMASPYVGLVPAALAPLLFGGFAGMASWLPIYPVDQVKTIIQNTDDEQAENKSMWSVTQQLYRDGGVAAFYDGLDAKLLRAFVHHAFTFAVFEIVMDMFRHASH